MVEISLPDTIWHKGVIAATSGWMIVLFGVGFLPTSVFGLLFFVSWILLPVAIYKDAKEVGEVVDWPKRTWVYLVTSLIWIVAFVPGLVYLWRRRKLSNIELNVTVETSIGGFDDSEFDRAEVPLDSEDDDFEHDFQRSTIEYNGAEYRCEYVEAEDGRWRAGYGRSYDTDDYRFFLQQDGELLYSKELKRGEDAAVADNGVVAVIDGLDREELSGKLYIFDSGDEQLFSHFFNSNVGACTISQDGSFAAVSTLNPDCTTHVFDIEKGRGVLEHENLEGNKMGLEFRNEDDELRLFLSEGRGKDPYYAINLNGEVVWKSEELQRKEKLQGLMDSSDTDDLEEALELLDEAYELAAGENEKKNVARKLADTHWQLARNAENDTDEWWSHLNQAKAYYTEILPWYDGKQGVAKVSRKQGKYHLKQGNEETAFELFQSIANLEEEYDVQLLTDADKRKLEELTAD